MKIVVTGSESFIGRELRRHAFAEGIGWVGIDMAAPEGNEHLRMDIRSPEIDKLIPENSDALIHLAAVSRTQECREDPKLAFDVNVGGTLNLIRAARERKVRQFIFASTEWIYGDVVRGEFQREDEPIEPDRIPSEYALSKFFGERVLFMAYRRGFCPVTILRFGIVYGPRPNNWSAVEDLFHTVRTKERVEVKGSLKTARRFIHVSDVANGILTALGRQGFEIFNISGDSLITLGEIIKTSQGLLSRQPEVVEKDPSAVSIHNADNRKACSVLGWKPQIDLKAGLQSLISNDTLKESACSGH